MSTTKAIFLAVAMLLTLPAEAAKTCHVKIFVYENGDVGVGATRYSDLARLRLRLGEYKERKNCEMHVVGDEHARYEAVGRVIAILQEFGYLKVGFLTEPQND